MKKTVLTVRWWRVFAFVVAVPILWLLFVRSPMAHVLWVIVAIAALSLSTGALRIRRGTTTRSMSEVIEDVETETPPIVVPAVSAVSLPRRA